MKRPAFMSEFFFFLGKVCLCGFYAFLVGLVHCSWDPQISFLTKLSLKIGSIALFTHLKIILLQYFQFSTK